jgi:hypothetical protein
MLFQSLQKLLVSWVHTWNEQKRILQQSYDIYIDLVKKIKQKYSPGIYYVWLRHIGVLCRHIKSTTLIMHWWSVHKEIREKSEGEPNEFKINSASETYGRNSKSLRARTAGLFALSLWCLLCKKKKNPVESSDGSCVLSRGDGDDPCSEAEEASSASLYKLVVPRRQHGRLQLIYTMVYTNVFAIDQNYMQSIKQLTDIPLSMGCMSCLYICLDDNFEALGDAPLYVGLYMP